jgi:hypothetical protein
VGDVFGGIQLTGYQTFDTTLNRHFSGPGVGADCGVPTMDEPHEPESDGNDDLFSTQGCGKDICTSLEESGGVLESLVFQLNLADARVYTNDQGDWKGGNRNGKSTFDPKTGSKTAIIRIKGNLLTYKQKHADGDKFKISATASSQNSLGTHITFVVQDTLTNSYKKTIKVRTKCDYPLNIGDKFGVLEIVGFVGSDGLSCTEATTDTNGDAKHASDASIWSSSWIGSLPNGAFAALVLTLVAVVLIGVVRMRRFSGKWSFSMAVERQNGAGANEEPDLTWDSSSLGWGELESERAVKPIKS